METVDEVGSVGSVLIAFLFPKIYFIIYLKDRYREGETFSISQFTLQMTAKAGAGPC